MPARPWRPAAVVPALIGLLAAGYLTVEHFSSSTTLACPDSGAINCTKVTTSSYSHILGVPVALVGLVYFLVMLALLTPAAWNRPELRTVRLAAAAAGVLSVVYLVWAELFRIDAICLWCTAVHICTVALFGAVLWYSTEA
jgi:uncharacterized membrane protein